ncbi:uncharacterized protein LOC134542216 [Bacillus rossius redtenbacheri]|uniref:uncharacterized protein LOC134542216 n=1 Tax=Bacillus rossius redtenbacheri TaxID=93214 RepID=UPI002FDCF5A1
MDDNSEMTASQGKKYERFKYSEEDLTSALEDIKAGNLSLNSAAKKYGVPKGTLHNKIMGKVPIQRKMGPDTVLTTKEEQKLEMWILSKAKLGFPMHPDVVQDAVQTVLNSGGRKTLFKDNRPGRKWLDLFLKRHPTIGKRNAEIISKGRASVTQEQISNWFYDLRTHLQEEGCEDVLQDGARIINCDETGMQLCPKTGKVLGPTDLKNFYEIAGGQEKESITVLCSFSANGSIIPPMIIYPYKRLPKNIAHTIPEEWGFGRSDSGWMVSSTFYEYIANIFWPWLSRNGVVFPVILFLDGHKSHLSLEVSELCAEKKIILYCLPPNATHILQPCDVTVFRALKVMWRKVYHSHKQSCGNITKANFAHIFKEAFDAAIKPDVIISGFRACGLFPCNPENVDYTKCISHRRQELKKERCQEEQTVPTKNDFKIAVKVIEYLIGPNKTEQFLQTEENTSLPVSNSSLFKVWKACREQVNEKSQVGHDRQATQNANNQDECELLNATDIPGIDDITLTTETDLLDIGSLPIEIDGIVFHGMDDTNITYGTRENLYIAEVEEEATVLSCNDGFRKEISMNIPSGTRKNLNVIEVEEEEETGMLCNDEGYTNKSKSTEEICVRDIVEDVMSMILEEVENKLRTDCKDPKENGNQHCNEDNATEKEIEKTSDQEIDLWEQHLHWPRVNEKKAIKRVQKEKQIYAISSNKWRELQVKKEDEKKAKQKIQQEKKENRKKRLHATVNNRPAIKRRKTKDKVGETTTVTSRPPETQAEFQKDYERKDVIPGTYILVKFKSGAKKNVGQYYKYVCVTQEVQGEEIKVVGLKSTENNRTFRVVDSDVSHISFSDIVAILPQPLIESAGDRIKYIFRNDIEIKEN